MALALGKLTGGDFTGKFSAWWDGRPYTPPEEGDGDDASETGQTNDERPKGAKTSKSSDPKSTESAGTPSEAKLSSRLTALEAIWGDGRFAPMSAPLQARLSEGIKISGKADSPKMGLINVDPATVIHMMGSTAARPVLQDWRRPCLDRFRLQFEDFDIFEGDPDRPKFEVASLSALFSVEAFTYSDHKAGLASRALKSLAPGGIFIVQDYVRGSAETDIMPVFATSWAEPQIARDDEITELCETAGFETIDAPEDISGDLSDAAETATRKFSESLETRLAQALPRVKKTLFLQEMAWEMEAWKWRRRALAAGLIQARVWRFRRP